MTASTALLVGATGLVGEELLTRLLAAPDYRRVHVLSRRPLGRGSPKLDVRIQPFDRLAELAAREPSFLSVHDVFCCLGTTLARAGSREAFATVDRDHVRDLAAACREAGAHRFFLVSAVGADPGSRFFYNRIKGEAEAAVRALDFPTLHIVRPSLLLGHRPRRRPGEALAQRLSPLFAPALAGPLARYRPIAAGAVADRLLSLAGRTDTGTIVTHPAAAA